MKRMFLIFSLTALFALSALNSYFHSKPGQPLEEEAKAYEFDVLIVERDIPQTRNLVPIVNHEVMVVNLSDEELEIDIKSPFPKELYVRSKFYPAFGETSLIAAPVYAPYEIEVSDYTILESPSIEVKEEDVIYSWRNVKIPAGEAVIAQYDNYFGDVNQYYTEEGLKIFELAVHTSHSAELEDQSVSLTLNYDLENKGEEDIEYLVFDAFLPYKLHLKVEEVELLEITEISASPEVELSAPMICDGFGTPANGKDAFVNAEKLSQGEHLEFFLKVRGIKRLDKGEIYPLLTIRCRIRGEQIWPPTVIEFEKELKVESFYYNECSLVIGDSKLFKLGPKSIELVEAKSISEPTFPPPTLKHVPPKGAPPGLKE